MILRAAPLSFVNFGREFQGFNFPSDRAYQVIEHKTPHACLRRKDGAPTEHSRKVPCGFGKEILAGNLGGLGLFLVFIARCLSRTREGNEGSQLLGWIERFLD
jgi:hypothetical protein